MVLSKLINVASCKAFIAAAALAPVLATASVEAEVNTVEASMSARTGQATRITAQSQADHLVQYRFSYKQNRGQWRVFRNWGAGNSANFRGDMSPQAHGMVILRVEARDTVDGHVKSHQDFFFEEEPWDTERIAPVDIQLNRGAKLAGRPITMTLVYPNRTIPATATREFFTFRDGDEFVWMHGARTISRARGEHVPGHASYMPFHTQRWTPRRSGLHYVGIRVTWTTSDGHTRTHYRVESLRVLNGPQGGFNSGGLKNKDLKLRDNVKVKPSTVIIKKNKKSSTSKNNKGVIILKP